MFSSLYALVLALFATQVRCFLTPQLPMTFRIRLSDLSKQTDMSTPLSVTQRLCLGIPNIARKGVRYFKHTVGTLLEGLDETERADIHLILFIAHTDPSQHPAYAEPWLDKLADQVLLYNASEVDIGHLQTLETDEAKASGLEKALFDYRYLLKACEAIDTPYIIMLEDDVVALDGWYHRTRDALASAETQTQNIGASKCEYLHHIPYSCF